MKKSTCYLCGSTTSVFVRIRLHWSYARCQYCGHIALYPLPSTDELRDIYEPDYYEDELRYPDYKAHDSFLQKILAWRLSQLETLCPAKGRLLDVGCGLGHFLHSAIAVGWEGYGIEISESAVAHCRQRFGLNVRQSTLKQARFDTGSFDVITLWDVLEHLVEPRSDLKEAHRVLAPGGLLAISMPNKDGVKARLRGNRWRYFRPEFGHVMHYSPQTLALLLEQGGFQVILIRTEGFFNLGFFLKELPALQRLQPLRGAFARMQQIADELVGCIGLGENMTVFARKQE